MNHQSPPLIAVPLDLSDEAAAKLIDFLLQIARQLENHYTEPLYRYHNGIDERQANVWSDTHPPFLNRLVPRIVACLSLVWTASALSGPLIGGAFATAGLWRFAFWSFALQGLVLATALHLLLARAESGSALQVRRVPVARLVFVAGTILAISLAGAIGSISMPRIEGTIR